MAKVPGFAKAFAGRWRIAAGFSGKGTTRMTPPAVADQASFAHAAEFFNSLLGRYAVHAAPRPSSATVRAPMGAAPLVGTGNCYFPRTRTPAKSLNSKDGRVAEWFKAPVLKF
jgi:hypothetical protein